MRVFLEPLIKTLEAKIPLSSEEIQALIETPPEPEMGDLAFPCFRLAKQLRQAPVKIAAQLAEACQAIPGFGKVQAEGPYLNFYYDRKAYAEAVMAEGLEGAHFIGHEPVADTAPILIDYSSPNIAKPLHVGHAFSTLLGASLSRIFQYLGHTVIRLNHLGDYGTQFGKLISAWLRWGDEEAFAQDPIAHLNAIYVRFHEEAKEDPALEEEAREYFLRLEQNDAKMRALWERFREQSLTAFRKVYQALDIDFDNWNGEQFYAGLTAEVVQRFESMGLLEESEGARVVNLDAYGLNPCIIIKSNGATIYSTRDIAAIYYRDETWDFGRNVYVVGSDQAYHFRQVFATMERAGFEKAKDCVHVGFGRVLFGQVKFSTRSGNTVLLEELMQETIQKVAAIIAGNHPEMPSDEREATAKSLGLSAISHTFLRNGREKDIQFSWEEMLDFEGDSAPYLVYTYARARSILRKAKMDEADLRKASSQDGCLQMDEAFALLKQIAGMEEAVRQSASLYEPSYLLRHLNSSARAFNRYYHHVRILAMENEEEKQAHLRLCLLFSETFKQALALCQMEAVERM